MHVSLFEVAPPSCPMFLKCVCKQDGVDRTGGCKTNGVHFG